MTHAALSAFGLGDSDPPTQSDRVNCCVCIRGHFVTPPICPPDLNVCIWFAVILYFSGIAWRGAHSNPFGAVGN